MENELIIIAQLVAIVPYNKPHLKTLLANGNTGTKWPILRKNSSTYDAYYKKNVIRCHLHARNTIRRTESLNHRYSVKLGSFRDSTSRSHTTWHEILENTALLSFSVGVPDEDLHILLSPLIFVNII